MAIKKTWLEKFKKDYQGKKVLIMGLGLLGRGLADAEFFHQIGALVTVTDLKTKKELAKSLKKLRKFHFNYVLGKHREKDFLMADVILRNAAVPYNSPFLTLARKKNIPIVMDEALFAQYAPVKMIGVTGTRGKSTTTTLIYKLLQLANYPVWLGGNIRGLATLPLLAEIKRNDWVVMELSSWQLQGFRQIKKSPYIAVLTNIYEDHLNRYLKMDDYIRDKKIIFKYQTKQDFLIINEKLKGKFANQTQAKLIYFSRKDIPASLLKIIKLKGKHNLENIAAVLKIAKILKINLKIVKKVLSNFNGLKFRLEKVASIDGVDYINDTTSTTPIAAIRALETFNQPIILIAGGASKNLNMEDFADKIAHKVKGVILLEGSATDKLQELIYSKAGKKIIWGRFNNLTSAFRLIKEKAVLGDVVLLSPGCASFGMFRNEFDRGQQFNKIIKELKC